MELQDLEGEGDFSLRGGEGAAWGGAGESPHGRGWGGTCGSTGGPWGGGAGCPEGRPVPPLVVGSDWPWAGSDLLRHTPGLSKSWVDRQWQWQSLHSQLKIEDFKEIHQGFWNRKSMRTLSVNKTKVISADLLNFILI